MATVLYHSPVEYGLAQVTIRGGDAEFPARVYYPSDEQDVLGTAIRPGTYPLVVFAHGNRSPSNDLCPTDVTHDYRRWSAVVHLWARCGFVVAVPDIHGRGPDAAVERVEATVTWMRSHWEDRAVLHQPDTFVDAGAIAEMSAERRAKEKGPFAAVRRPLDFGVGVDPHELRNPTPLGLVGHSWGAVTCGLVAARRSVPVDAFAAIAGSWEHNGGWENATLSARAPTLLIAGTGRADEPLHLDDGYVRRLWPSLARPKHAAMLQGVGHWDWWPTGVSSEMGGGIWPCDRSLPKPTCPVAWLTASELVLGFLTKYLLGLWQVVPPHLLGDPGVRPPLLPWYHPFKGCALKTRWEDPVGPFVGSSVIGEHGLGSWSEPSPW